MFTNIALFFSSMLFFIGSLVVVLVNDDYNTGIEYQLMSLTLIIILHFKYKREIQSKEAVFNKYVKRMTVDELYGRDNDEIKKD